MPDTSKHEAWGVTVDQVIAVASQAGVLSEDATPPTGPTNDVFQQGSAAAQLAQKVTRDQVLHWINQVGMWVSNTLHRRGRLAPSAKTEFEGAMSTAIEVGAAAYVVDAAYPQRAGAQDQASYGQVLWTRYRQALDDLKDALQDRLTGPDDSARPAANAGDLFPPARFTDAWVAQNTSSVSAAPDPYRAPGAETPYPYPGW